MLFLNDVNNHTDNTDQRTKEGQRGTDMTNLG
jgi:hypothetical protein